MSKFCVSLKNAVIVFLCRDDFNGRFSTAPRRNVQEVRDKVLHVNENVLTVCFLDLSARTEKSAQAHDQA